MKTIAPISAVLLCAVMSLSAQEFRDQPTEAPDPAKPAPPPEMKELLEHAPGPDPHMPGLEQPPQTESELRQREALDRIRRDMVAPTPHQHGEVQEFRQSPWLIGISVAPIEPFVRAHLGLEEDAGVRVSMVGEGTPAAQAGIVVDDIVISANGQKISSVEGLKEAVEKSGKNDQPVSLDILHQGQRKTLSIVPRGPKPERQATPQPQDTEQRQNNLVRRLNRQEKLISELREEIAKLRKKVDKMERAEDGDQE
jgi:hypothetical protein